MPRIDFTSRPLHTLLYHPTPQSSTTSRSNNNQPTRPPKNVHPLHLPLPLALRSHLLPDDLHQHPHPLDQQPLRHTFRPLHTPQPGPLRRTRSRHTHRLSHHTLRTAHHPTHFFPKFCCATNSIECRRASRNSPDEFCKIEKRGYREI